MRQKKQEVAPRKAPGGDRERPNPRVPRALMSRVRVFAKREGETVNLAIITLIKRGLKAGA